MRSAIGAVVIQAISVLAVVDKTVLEGPIGRSREDRAVSLTGLGDHGTLEVSQGRPP